ncbi:MAG: CHAT domain-containing protein [Azospirillum sp.]|nr:CHAT domain-containing protein [Azospirillum sp.]
MSRIVALGVVFCLAVSVWQPVAAKQAPRPASRGGGEAGASSGSIADITAILDRERPDPERARHLRETADQALPAGADPARMIESLYQRGLAASLIGRTSQQLADFREAVRLAEANPGTGDLPTLLHRLAVAETRAGHRREGLRLRERMVQVIQASGEKFARLTTAYATLAVGYAEFGDLAEARSWQDKLNRLLTRLRSGKNYGEFGVLWEMWPPLVEATILQYEGKLRDAEEAYRRHLAQVEKAAAANVQTGREDLVLDNIDRARMNLALQVLLPQGRVREAEVEVRRALLAQLVRRGRYAPESAAALESLAAVLAEQGRFDDALKLARAGIDVYERTGHGRDSGALAKARMRLGAILSQAGRGSEALAVFEALDRDLVGSAELRARLLAANRNYAAALLAGGRAAAAVAVFSRAVEHLAQRLGSDHPRVAFLRGEQAVALAAAGDRAAALAGFRAALPALVGDNAAQVAANDEDQGAVARQHRRQMILEGYIALLADRIAGGGNAADIAEAFRLADAARGQAVQRAVAAAASRVAVGGGELSALVRREQDAGAELAARQSLIAEQLATPSDQRDAALVKRLSEEAEDLAQSLRTLRQDLARHFPRYAELRSPAAPTVAEVQAVMHPGEALIAVLVGDSRTLVWAVPPHGPPVFAAVPLARAKLAELVAALRRELDPGSDILAKMPRYDTAAAYRLYQALLSPVEAGWRGAKTLLVVPDKALGQLPFAVLVTEPASLPERSAGAPLFAEYRNVPWLVRQAAIVQLPSVNALVALRGAEHGSAAPKPFLGFGDPWFNAAEAAEGRRERGVSRGAQLASRGAGHFLRRATPPRRDGIEVNLLKLLPRLPETADEVREAATALGADPERDVILGDQVNEKTVATMRLDDRRVVMFATHGLIPGDLPGLAQPALAMSAPEVAGVTGGSGLLTLEQVLGLKLNADWVVLSACNTAAGDGAGAEAVSGLGRAFFYAGTRALLVTQWPVESTSAAALTTGTFRHQAETPGLSRAEALRLTELDLIDHGGYRDAPAAPPLFSYAHPAFWAPYTLVGDGG